MKTAFISSLFPSLGFVFTKNECLYSEKVVIEDMGEWFSMTLLTKSIFLIIAIAFIFLLPTSSYGQTNITAAEYFIDIDPGPGNGTVITGFSAATTIDVSTFNIPTTSLAIGRHLLCVRTKNANNAWGYYDCRAFYISGPNTPITPNPPTANITAAEYFIDTDPGPGNGTVVTGFSAGTTIDVSTFNIPTTSLAIGRHLLCVRTKNANNVWGYYDCRAFYINAPNAPITPDPPPTNITALEYFFDTAPAPGSGIAIQITAGTDIALSTFNIPTTSLATGWHILGIRGRNANGTWGNYDVRRVFIQSSVVPPVTPAVSPIVAFEYSIDADPGVGSGTFSLPVSPASNSVDLVNQNLNVGSLALGTHKLVIRGNNQNNQWGFYEVRNFSVCNQVPTTISAATSLTTTSFTANWSAATGATSYQLDVSKDNFATFVTGYNNKTVVALSQAITGLTPATGYQYRVRAVSSCASDYSTATTTTLLPLPTAQPTNLTFSSTANSLALTFNDASGSHSGYLAIRKEGISPTFTPVNNIAYTQGQILPGNNGTIAYAGAAPAFLDAGLSPDTEYYYDLFSYNQSGSLYSYLTSITPLQGNSKTLALEPTSQPTAINFSLVKHNGFTVSFTPAANNPAGYLVLRKVGLFPASVPQDGTTYTTTVATDEIAYTGSSSSFIETWLTQNSEYYYTVFAYNGSGPSINYNIVSPLQGTQLTPITPPSSVATNLTFSNVTPGSMTVSYSPANGNPSGYLVIRKTGSSPSFTPQSNTLYSNDQNLGGDMRVAYVGSGLTFNQNGLMASTEYFYDVFAYNQNGSLVSYQIIAPLKGSKVTFTAEPTTQPVNILFSEPTTSSLKISFTEASPTSSGYLVTRKANSSSLAVPVDGETYTTISALTDAIVVYSGTSTQFTDTNLLPGTTYFYQAFSYNGSGAAINYLTANPSSGSKITLPDKPVFADVTESGQSQFRINWVVTTGADNYQLDVSKDNFQTFVTGFNNISVSSTSLIVKELESGTAYKFRVRAVNTSGTSVNSEEKEQFTIPATPLTIKSSSVGQTSFTANWNSVKGATAYFIDVSIDSQFTSFFEGYQNKSLANVTTETINGLKPGITYYYRIRSVNQAGTSTSSVIVNQLLIPATPTGLEAKAINTSTTYFRAEWPAVTGATRYRIDVSTESNFNTLLSDYNNRLTDENAPQQLITGLASGTDYWFRVRSENDEGTSPNSVSLKAQTQLPGTGQPLQLSLPTYPPVFDATPVAASIVASGGTPPYSITFYYRPITGNNFIPQTITSTNATYTASINDTMLDEMGTEFYFKVVDATGIPVQSLHYFIYRAFSSSQKAIPAISSGGQLKDYTIFSIPYTLADNDIADIFEELGRYEKFRWRLVRYQNGKNVDYTEGLTKIESGKGYWFNALEKTEVKIGEGITPQVNQDTPFKLKLDKDWNQIGDPFPFNIDWSDVLTANPSVASKVDQRILSYDGPTTSFRETDILRAWGGGFVFANEAVDLTLPVTLKNTSSGGRKNQTTISSADLSSPGWFVPITLTHGGAEHNYGGFGMHPEANKLKDIYDKHTLPRFVNYLEWNTYHPEFFNPWFTKDVVTTMDSHTWSFQAESNFPTGQAILNWDNQRFPYDETQLLLLDEKTQTLIDMKKTGQYAFDLNGTRSFKVYFSKDKASLHPDVNLLGLAYPNPLNDITTIPFIINEKMLVQIEIYDLTGRKVKQLTNRIHEAGVHTTTWDGTDQSGERVANGIYLYRMNNQQNKAGAINRIVVK